MYLSRVELQLDRRETMLALSQQQLMHGAVERCFSGGRERRLWRVDWLESHCYLLVLSHEPPEFTALWAQFGPSDEKAHWETKDYSTLLSKLKNGQIWHFRLKANPVHSITSEQTDAKRGKVTAHVTTAQQKQWLLSRTESLGITLREEEFDVTHTQWYSFDKGDRQRVTLRTASFEGVLTLTDTQKFTEAMLSGVGRAKAYGCGLLTISQ